MVGIGVDVVLFGLIGLLAGAHCIGMCGPLVTVYAERMRGDDTPQPGALGAGQSAFLSPFHVRQHALFNLGRAASYTVIGAIFGGIGGLFFLSMGHIFVAADVIRGFVGVIVGTGIIVIGAYYASGRAVPSLALPGSASIGRLLRQRVDRWVNGFGIAGLGAVHGVLPCPILYPAYLFAFATGSASAGAVALAALGLGTIPAVFLYGTIIGDMNVRHRRRVHRFLGVAFLVLGYVLFAHGLASIGLHIPHPELPFWDPIGNSGHGSH